MLNFYHIVSLILATFASSAQYAATEYPCDEDLPEANEQVSKEICFQDGSKWSSGSELYTSVTKVTQLIYQLPRTGCRELMQLYEELLSIEGRYLKTVVHFETAQGKREFDVVAPFETYSACLLSIKQEHKKLHYLHYALENIFSTLRVYSLLQELHGNVSVLPKQVLEFARARFLFPLGVCGESGSDLQGIKHSYPDFFKGHPSVRMLSSKIVEALGVQKDYSAFAIFSLNFKKLMMQAVENNSKALCNERARFNHIVHCIGSKGSEVQNHFNAMIQTNNLVAGKLNVGVEVALIPEVKVKDLKVSNFASLSKLGGCLYPWETQLITDVALDFSLQDERGCDTFDLMQCLDQLPCAGSLFSLIISLQTTKKW